MKEYGVSGDKFSGFDCRVISYGSHPLQRVGIWEYKKARGNGRWVMYDSPLWGRRVLNLVCIRKLVANADTIDLYMVALGAIRGRRIGFFCRELKNISSLETI